MIEQIVMSYSKLEEKRRKYHVLARGAKTAKSADNPVGELPVNQADILSAKCGGFAIPAIGEAWDHSHPALRLAEKTLRALHPDRVYEITCEYKEQ